MDISQTLCSIATFYLFKVVGKIDLLQSPFNCCTTVAELLLNLKCFVIFCKCSYVNLTNSYFRNLTTLWPFLRMLTIALPFENV